MAEYKMLPLTYTPTEPFPQTWLGLLYKFNSCCQSRTSWLDLTKQDHQNPGIWRRIFLRILQVAIQWNAEEAMKCVQCLVQLNSEFLSWGVGLYCKIGYFLSNFMIFGEIHKKKLRFSLIMQKSNSLKFEFFKKCENFATPKMNDFGISLISQNEFFCAVNSNYSKEELV